MQHKRYGHHFKQVKSGFTIVELLIVIVVIAILAAITIVAYNGITQRANASALQSAAESAAKKVATYALTNNDVLPPDLATVGIANTGSTSYQYSVNTTTTPQGYCITTTNNNVAYYVGSNFVYSGGTINQLNPASGACPGHSATGQAITNYSQNPGVEVSVGGLNGTNGTTFVRDTSKAHSGAASVLLTMPANGSTYVVGGAIVAASDYLASTGLSANTTYNASAWVYVPSGTVDISLLIQGTGKTLPGTLTPTRVTSVKNQWVRIDEEFTTTVATGSLNIFAVNVTGTTAGQQFWMDDMMITQGSTPYNYADGSTPGWVWNGTAGRSSSTGPPV